MGNYKNVDTEFIERTIYLIEQYEQMMHKYEFNEQYNHTLLTNCLLGIIVFPKETSISFLPTDRITKKLKNDMGIFESYINENINNLRDLVISLRHSIAHFDIVFESQNNDFLIDRIVFKDKDKGDNYIIASFLPSELLSFIRYYGYWLIGNIRQYKKEIYE